MTEHHGSTRRPGKPGLLLALLGALPLLLMPACDTTGPPADVIITISFDAASLQPVVDRDTVWVERSATVLWRSALGQDTAWVVRLTGTSPFVNDLSVIESKPDPGAPTGAVIRRDAPVGVYPYVVKLIVNDGADTLGVDPQIHVRDPT